MLQNIIYIIVLLIKASISYATCFFVAYFPSTYFNTDINVWIVSGVLFAVVWLISSIDELGGPNTFHDFVDEVDFGGIILFKGGVNKPWNKKELVFWSLIRPNSDEFGFIDFFKVYVLLGCFAAVNLLYWIF
ncbi:MAG: hypothetical protein ACXITV_12350 [Luteibaculaceae bacterium]